MYPVHPDLPTWQVSFVLPLLPSRSPHSPSTSRVLCNLTDFYHSLTFPYTRGVQFWEKASEIFEWRITAKIARPRSTISAAKRISRGWIRVRSVRAENTFARGYHGTTKVMLLDLRGSLAARSKSIESTALNVVTYYTWCTVVRSVIRSIRRRPGGRFHHTRSGACRETTNAQT